MKLEKEYTEEGLRELRANALFHLGRVLYEQALGTKDGRFDPAVDRLQEAVELSPNNPAAYYYLGQAIRGMIERNFQKRADDALRTYLARGAPLGHEDEVREILGIRKSKREGGAVPVA